METQMFFCILKDEDIYRIIRATNKEITDEEFYNKAKEKGTAYNAEEFALKFNTVSLNCKTETLRIVKINSNALSSS